MRVLVAGGAGYIGSRLVPHLMNAGHEITVVDLLWFGNNLPKEVPVLVKDIVELQEEDVRGFDAVIFLAGLSNDPMAEFSPALNFTMNSAAVGYLAYISKRAGVKRFVYAGSCSVYGFTGDELSTEESVPKTQHPYGISKLMGELSALHLSDEAFSVLCLRQGTVSGWSPRMRFDLLINTMYAHAHRDGVVTVNNASIWRPIFAMTDVINVFQRALEAPVEKAGTYNVFSENISIGDAAERVKAFFKKKHGMDIAVDIKEVQDVRNYRAVNEKAIRDLDISFEGSVESILEDIDSQIPADTDFNDEKYYNIRTFKNVLSQ